jgi:hypothetical protein
VPERELRDGVADSPLDSLGPESDLGIAVPLAPFVRSVRVAHRHADDRDRREHPADRDDAGNATAGADDHLAAELLPEDAVRRADVALGLGRDRRRLEPHPGLAERGRPLVDDGVAARAAGCEREVVAGEADLEPDHVRREHSQRFLEQLLPGLVAFENYDCARVHDVGSVPDRPRSRRSNRRAAHSPGFAVSICVTLPASGPEKGG